MAARSDLFQKLKPLCVPLFQLAVKSSDKASDSKEITRLIEELLKVWLAQARSDAAVLDEKLADYVFFPLSRVLRGQDEYPVRVIEATIQLLGPLIQYGWKDKISEAITQQLLLFLSFMVGGVPGQENEKEVPEETTLAACQALTALFAAAGSSSSALASLLETKMIPSLGHTVSVVLDLVLDGKTPAIQLEALQSLSVFYTIFKDNSVPATFLPGTVSSLSKTLSPPSSSKLQRRVLVRGVQVLASVITAVLGDIKIRHLIKDASIGGGPPEEDEKNDESSKQKVLTPAWLRATGPQIKLALSSVLKLRTHEASDVRQAVHKLCISLLDECHVSLANCKSILVETSVMLGPEDAEKSLYETNLEDLTRIYPELGDVIKTTMYNWTTSLPRVMQSSEERHKQQAIRDLTKGNHLISALQLDSTTLEDALSASLKDSVVALVLGAKAPKILHETDAKLDQSLFHGTGLAKTPGDLMRAYSPVLLEQEGQRQTREEVLALLNNIGSSAQQTKLAAEMLGYVRDSEGVEQISSYWIAFELLKAGFAKSADIDSFLDFTSLGASDQQESVFRELYEFSGSVVSSHSDAVETDWRLEAIALEVVAYCASRMKTDFRPELIDVLYPITTYLGSPYAQLRTHAITTLNSIAASCGYSHVSELIIDNVDYMVNSVSLRLNTFDISPASTRVLTMMIRLTGPRLIPYLDDVVASIFAALDNYHGYTSFVEALFSVLSEVVDQGVKSDKLLLEGGPNVKAVDHRKRPPESGGIDELLGVLTQRAQKRAKRAEDLQDEELAEGHPKQPWKSEQFKLPQEAGEEEEDGDEATDETDDPPAPSSTEVDKSAATPTYTLLNRVTTLTQHYLTSPTPTLRKLLLDLLGKVTPALAPDEDKFLPLVNALWPVMVARLHDGEPFVVVAACRALAVLCAGAGDFLSSRLKTEWADGLGQWCRKRRDEAAGSRDGRKKVGGGRPPPGARNIISSRASAPAHSLGGRGIVIATHEAGEKPGLQLVRATGSARSDDGVSPSTGGLGRFAQAAQVWDAAVGLLTAIVTYVRIDDAMFDQILDILEEVIPHNHETREALEVVNADAVWLALHRRGGAGEVAEPKLGAVRFAPLLSQAS